MNLSLLNLTKLFFVGTNSEVFFTTFTGISLLQFTGLVLYKMVLLAKRNKGFLISKCRREVAEDEVEDFELAEVEKESESDSNDEEQYRDDDMDNLPNH